MEVGHSGYRSEVRIIQYLITGSTYFHKLCLQQSELLSDPFVENLRINKFLQKMKTSTQSKENGNFCSIYKSIICSLPPLWQRVPRSTKGVIHQDNHACRHTGQEVRHVFHPSGVPALGETTQSNRNKQRVLKCCCYFAHSNSYKAVLKVNYSLTLYTLRQKISQ